MVIIELNDLLTPEVTGGPVTSFDRQKVMEHLGTEHVGVVNHLGAPVWCRDAEAKRISNWYAGQEVVESREEGLEVLSTEDKYLWVLSELREMDKTINTAGWVKEIFEYVDEPLENGYVDEPLDLNEYVDEPLDLNG